MHSVISKLLVGFEPILKSPPLASEKFEETHKTLIRLRKEMCLVLKGEKRILHFFRGRLTALGVQVARLTRTMVLLEELLELPNMNS